MKTDIILFNPDTRLKKRIWMPNQPLSFLPMSLLAISGPLMKSGFRVKIIDQRVELNWREVLLNELKNDPVCIGITVMAGSVVEYAIEVSKFVRENSDIPIVWGGVHPSLLPEQTIENPNIDIVVKGEGEETFLELVNALKNKISLDNIRGIYYKQDNHIKNTGLRPYVDLNKQPTYPYHLINMRKYILQGPAYRIVDFSSSRGCPSRCSFCGHSYYDPGHWSALSAEETLNRIRQLRLDFGINGIWFWDDNFFINMERAKSILEGFVREKFNTPFHRTTMMFSTLSKLNQSFLKFLQDSGVLSLFIGIESGSKRMLKLMNKEMDIPEVISTNKRISKFQIYPHYSFIIGLPTETQEELSQTVKLYLRLIEENKRATGTFCIYTPRIGTELFNLSLKYGLKMPRGLEEWIKYPYTYSDPSNSRPWIDKQKRKLLMNLRFCSVIIFSARKYVYIHKTSILFFKYLFQLSAKLYLPIVKMRLNSFNFRLFFERYIIDFIIGKY